MSRLDFLLLPYFAYIEHFTKFTRESFLFKEKSLLMENQKRKKVVGEEKKKKRAQRRKKEYQSVKKERVPICQEKKENFPCESDWYWRSSMLASRFWTKKSPSNQNLPYIMLKTRFPFLSASTSLDITTLTLYSNHNFESCMSIRCFAPQHILQFFHFCRGFFLRLWELCSSLCRPPLSDRD